MFSRFARRIATGAAVRTPSIRGFATTTETVSVWLPRAAAAIRAQLISCVCVFGSAGFENCAV